MTKVICSLYCVFVFYSLENKVNAIYKVMINSLFIQTLTGH